MERSKGVKIFLLLIFFSGVYAADNRFLHVPEKVIASYRGTAIITIRYNISKDDQDVTPSNRKFKTVIVEYKDQNDQSISIATGTNSEFFLNKSPFKERSKTNYTILDANNGIFELTIGDLAYRDDVTMKTILLYDESNELESEQDFTNLIVQGGPTLCGKQMPVVQKFNLAKPVSIPLTLCGNQQPRLFYTFGTSTDRILVTNITNTSNKHEYVYTINLMNLKPSDCNSILQYTAEGLGADLTHQSRIDLDFIPTPTNIVAIREGLCVTTTWTSIQTGACDDIIYNIDYFLDDQASQQNKTNVTTPPFTTNSRRTCFATYDEAIAIKSVTLRAFYRTFQSAVQRVTVRHITTTTTTTTTMTVNYTQTNNSNFTGNKGNDEDIVLIAALAGGVGFLVILIIIILVVCVCRKRDKTSNLQMHSIHEYDVNLSQNGKANDKVRKQPPLPPAPYGTISKKNAKNNPVYDIDPAPTTHHSFGNNNDGNSNASPIIMGVSRGSVTIEREGGEFVDRTASSITPSKASSVRVGDAQLRYYDPNEFDIPPDDVDNENAYATAYHPGGDRFSPPVSPAPPPAGDSSDYSYNLSYEHDNGETRKPDLV